MRNSTLRVNRSTPDDESELFVSHLLASNVRSLRKNPKPRPCHIDLAIARSACNEVTLGLQVVKAGNFLLAYISENKLFAV